MIMSGKFQAIKRWLEKVQRKSTTEELMESEAELEALQVTMADIVAVASMDERLAATMRWTWLQQKRTLQ